MIRDWQQALSLSLAVGLGGMLGALSRWVVGEASARIFGTDFPYGTLCVNLIGSLAFGLLLGTLERNGVESPVVRAALFTGFLGAFTTFSTFSIDSVGLYRLHGGFAALGYIGLSVAGGVALAWLGLRATGA